MNQSRQRSIENAAESETGVESGAKCGGGVCTHQPTNCCDFKPYWHWQPCTNKRRIKSNNMRTLVYSPQHKTVAAARPDPAPVAAPSTERQGTAPWLWRPD